ncbi:MAG: tetrathionate reductase family octaheme c-type cytochrome, partial [Desulfobacteraceae bacterium]
MKKRIWIGIMTVLPLFVISFVLILPSVWADKKEKTDQAPGRTMAQQATKEKHVWITTDHRKIAKLKQPFKSGPEITQACLACHLEAENQFHKTIHWTWIGSTSQGKRYGKAGDSLNNFCLSTNNGQDKKCLTCHPGWNNMGNKGTVNCLICHGQEEINWSESFEDLSAFTKSSDPEEIKIAEEIQAAIQNAVQSVGLPTRRNCGGCHFKGGGGDGVKHGDLDSSITKPNKALDVHMGLDGQNFQCTRCHTTVLHNVAGRIYSTPAATDRKSLIDDDRIAKITCESCHSSTPHKHESKANDHTDKVACQSCHIPEFARVNPTKMEWDWSKAGKTKNGEKYKEKGYLGKEIYMSIKGEMKWAKNVKPEYFWWNGSIKTMTVKDTIDPSIVVPVTKPSGEPNASNARIFPFKVHHGKQPYDKVNKNLLAPFLSGPDGYWTNLDWPRALSKGMAALNVPYSNQFDFVKTTYVFPTTHMVAPKEKVVNCTQC